MRPINEYRALFIKHLAQRITVKEPLGLYEPVHYILSMPAKRLRPVLTLMTADIFGAETETALDAALAVELFHNFTLMHDDIMDNALLRRGQKTVHEKWNVNTGILSGDVMFVMAQQCLALYPPKIFAELADLFHTIAVKVCEGQQYDVDFETRQQVTVPEYLKMIEYKTAVLVAAAMKMGAITANASREQAVAVYNFGLHLGIAFQLKDDYLDAFGTAETFGKQIGGDITANKKTFLYLKAMTTLHKAGAEELQQLYSGSSENNSEKVKRVKELFLESKADVHTLTQVNHYTQCAFDFLEMLAIDTKAKAALRSFAEGLMDRTV